MLLFSFWVLAKIIQNDPFASNKFTFLPKWKHHVRLQHASLSSKMSVTVKRKDPQTSLAVARCYDFQTSRNSGPGECFIPRNVCTGHGEPSRGEKAPGAPTLAHCWGCRTRGVNQVYHLPHWASATWLPTWVTGWQTAAGACQRGLSPWTMYPVPGFTPRGRDWSRVGTWPLVTVPSLSSEPRGLFMKHPFFALQEEVKRDSKPSKGGPFSADKMGSPEGQTVVSIKYHAGFLIPLKA